MRKRRRLHGRRPQFPHALRDEARGRAVDRGVPRPRASASRWPTPPPPSACSAAIGEPEHGRHAQRPAPVAHLRQQGHQDLSRRSASSTAWRTRSSRSSRYFRHAAQGLEEKKQILYLLGPVGGGKSSIAERLKQLMEQVPFYAIKGSPVNESPLGLFDDDRGRPAARRASTASRAATCNASCRPWAVKRLRGIRRRHPQVQGRQALPVDPASRSASPRPSRATRTTRTSRRWSARSTSASSRPIAQDDPDAYSYSGGLCLANQGLLEFVEMFKAPIKVLHPLLTATQEGNFKGTEGFGAIPFDGIVLAHSQRERVEGLPQQQEQRGLPRPHLHRQGAVLPARVRGGQDLREAAAQLVAGRGAVRARHAEDDGAVRGADAPEGAGELAALLEDAGLRRREPEGHRPASAKSYQEYRDYAGVDEGMSGISTRFAFKILSKVFNFDTDRSRGQPGAPDVRARAADRARAVPGRDRAEVPRLTSRSTWRRATPSSSARKSRPPTSRRYSEYGQNIFDRYVTYADYWIQDQEFRDTDTGESLRPRRAERRAREDREAGRHLATRRTSATRSSTSCCARAPTTPARTRLWTSYEKLRTVIEKKMFSNTEELLPVISFNAKASADEAEEARGLRQPHGREGLHARSRCACCASGTCACARAA